MCFSPESSFVVAGGLAPMGAYCVWAAWRKAPRLLPLAAIPVALAAQQASEGQVWLAFERGDEAAVRPPALVFLFFALAWWPFWFPFQAAVAERRPGRRRALVALAAVTLGWYWLLFHPLVVDPLRLHTAVVHHSIRYEVSLPVDEYAPRSAVRALYLASIVLPLLFGPRAMGPAPGLALAAAAAVAAAVYEYAFASVWCFFAAVLSFGLLIVFARLPARPGACDATAAPLRSCCSDTLPDGATS